MKLNPHSVYDLEGSLKGKKLYIVAPGPTSKIFKFGWIEGQPIIALNSAIEFCKPTWWMLSDKKVVRRYAKNMSDGEIDSIVLPSHFVHSIEKFFRGSTVHQFKYQLAAKEYSDDESKPRWYNPKEMYLPGRCSVAVIAMSLAQLMQPDCVILIGIDFSVGDDGEYYRPGIRQNAGPVDIPRALSSGRRSFASSLKKGRWPGLKIYTTSWLLGDFGGRVKKLTIYEAAYAKDL